jgi:hypothetical protein
MLGRAYVFSIALTNEADRPRVGHWHLGEMSASSVMVGLHRTLTCLFWERD